MRCGYPPGNQDSIGEWRETEGVDELVYAVAARTGPCGQRCCQLFPVCGQVGLGRPADQHVDRAVVALQLEAGQVFFVVVRQVG